jgi:hypothetical protein
VNAHLADTRADWRTIAEVAERRCIESRKDACSASHVRQLPEPIGERIRAYEDIHTQ